MTISKKKVFPSLKPRWMVRERAESLDLSFEDFQFGIRTSNRKVAEGIWNNTAKQVTTDMIARIAHVLKTTNIGDFLVLEPIVPDDADLLASSGDQYA